MPDALVAAHIRGFDPLLLSDTLTPMLLSILVAEILSEKPS